MGEEGTESSPSYAFEMAFMIGGALLIFFLCQQKKKAGDRGQIESEVDNEVSDGNNNEQKNEENEMKEHGSTAKKDATEIDQCESSFVTQESESIQDDVTDASTITTHDSSNNNQQGKTGITCDTRSTQTEGVQCDTPSLEGNQEPDLAILWRAILVEEEAQKQMRYRTELHMKIDGEITHCESFQKEGIVGAGMQQVLVKVQ